MTIEREKHDKKFDQFASGDIAQANITYHQSARGCSCCYAYSLFLQWYLITELFKFAAGLMKTQLIQQAPDGVDAEAIKATFNRVEQAMRAMPLSYLRGQVRLRKVRIAIDYALKATEDGLWSAEEINTLLKMTDAAVGFRGKE